MLRIILHEPDLQCGVTDRHSSSTNTVGLACEHDYVGLTHTHPIKHSTVFLMVPTSCMSIVTTAPFSVRGLVLYPGTHTKYK